jgi:hypothetical protein
MQCPTTIYKFTRHRWIFGKDTSFGSLQISISISSHNEGEEQIGEAQQQEPLWDNKYDHSRAARLDHDHHIIRP